MFERQEIVNKEYEEKMQRRAKILNVARDEVPEYFGDLSEEEDIEVEEEVDF